MAQRRRFGRVPVVWAVTAAVVLAACGSPHHAAGARPSTTSAATTSTTSTTVAPSTTTATTTPPTAAPTTAPPHTAPPPPATLPPPPPPPPTIAPPVGGSRVYVLGDSVLLGTVQTLPAALAGWTVTMDCVGSRRLPQAIPVLQANRSRLGSVVVIQMGNNYIAGEDGTFASQIDQAMQVLRGVPRVVWVTVAEKWPSRVEINAAIRGAAGRWPTIRVADWAPVVAAHPEYAGDMLHLTDAGRLAISRLIAAAVGPPTR